MCVEGGWEGEREGVRDKNQREKRERGRERERERKKEREDVREGETTMTQGTFQIQALSHTRTINRKWTGYMLIRFRLHMPGKLIIAFYWHALSQ